ncbi:MAG: hypothetical protein WA751_11250 [Candidatus Dormiibacterota bacterium]
MSGTDGETQATSQRSLKPLHSEISSKFTEGSFSTSCPDIDVTAERIPAYTLDHDAPFSGRGERRLGDALPDQPVQANSHGSLERG